MVGQDTPLGDVWAGGKASGGGDTEGPLSEGSKEGEAATGPQAPGAEWHGARRGEGFSSSLRVPDGPWPGILRQVSGTTFPSKHRPLSLPGT